MHNVQKYLKAHKHLKSRERKHKYRVLVLKDDKVLLQVTLSTHEQVMHFQKECIKHDLKVIVRKE